MQQILIVFLVLGKWIAPSDLSVEEQARVLLTYIATGADIVNILALASSDQVGTQLRFLQPETKLVFVKAQLSFMLNQEVIIIGVARIFDGGGRSNNKSHAMTPSETFCGTKIS